MSVARTSLWEKSIFWLLPHTIHTQSSIPDKNMKGKKQLGKLLEETAEEHPQDIGKDTTLKIKERNG